MMGMAAGQPVEVHVTRTISNSLIKEASLNWSDSGECAFCLVLFQGCTG